MRLLVSFFVLFCFTCVKGVEPIVGEWQVLANGNAIVFTVSSVTNGVLGGATFAGAAATGYWSSSQQKVTFERNDWQTYVGYLYTETNTRTGATTTYLSGYFDVWYTVLYHRFSFYATLSTTGPSIAVIPQAVGPVTYQIASWNFYTNNTIGTLSTTFAGAGNFPTPATSGTATGYVPQLVVGVLTNLEFQTAVWDSQAGTTTIWAAASGAVSTATIYHGYLQVYTQTQNDVVTTTTIISGYYTGFGGNADLTEFGFHAIYVYTPSPIQ